MKYGSKESTHTPSTLRAIPLGVLNRLVKITSRKPSIQSKAVDTIYPAHMNALCKADLAPPVFPTMGELWGKQDESVEKNKERDVSVNKNKNVYFYVAYSCYFSTEIHRVTDRLKKSFNLTWLRVSALCFPNNGRIMGKTG